MYSARFATHPMHALPAHPTRTRVVVMRPTASPPPPPPPLSTVVRSGSSVSSFSLSLIGGMLDGDARRGSSRILSANPADSPPRIVRTIQGRSAVMAAVVVGRGRRLGQRDGDGMVCKGDGE